MEKQKPDKVVEKPKPPKKKKAAVSDLAYKRK